jgi:uncharacterized protein
MKLHADRAEGVNVINAYEPGAVSVNGQVYRRSVLIPHRGDVLPWDASTVADLSDTHFAAIAQDGPELVIIGSGAHIRFPAPAVLRPLMTRRIGFETMDTAAACRTYNVLVAEGRKVMAALLLPG